MRSKLPTPTLGVLRLVCRAARDDFVDARCTAVWRVWGDAPLSALASAAPRLRSLASLTLCWPPTCLRHISGADCVTLAELLGRLPGGAASLRELRLGRMNLAPDRRLEHLAAAIGRLPGLQSLALSIEGTWCNGTAALVNAAVEASLRALTRLSLSFVHGLAPTKLPAAREQLRLPPQSLQRLEALDLNEGATKILLPLLFEAPGASSFARLRDLDINLGFIYGYGSHDEDDDNALPPAPWHVPWLSQLTRLAVAGGVAAMQYVSGALEPGAVTALRTLEIDCPQQRGLTAGMLRSLLAALGGAAALQTFALSGATVAVVNEAAAALPALRALRYTCSDFVCDESIGFTGFVSAPLAPLTRLELDTFGCLRPDGPGFAPLFASAWAQGLRELSLLNLYVGTHDEHTRHVLNELRGLSALTALRRLSIDISGFDAPALEAAAAEGAADGWAPRLAELRLHLKLSRADSLRALLRLPLRRLERLGVYIAVSYKLKPDDLDAFSRACCAALPRLAALDLFCDPVYTR